MRWRVSAWTHPASASFKVIEHSIPIISGTFTDPEEPRGRCTFIVAASYPWQDLINADPVTPANNRNALIRLYRDGIDNTGEPDQEFYLDRFRRRILDDGTEVVLLSGPSWRIAGLDAAVLRWFDWEPGNTVSRQRDWSYGGDDQQNLLRNLDYRGSGEQEKQQYHLHAASGNYTITVPTFGTTGNLQPYEAGGRASDVKTALEAVAGINHVAICFAFFIALFVVEVSVAVDVLGASHFGDYLVELGLCVEYVHRDLKVIEAIGHRDNGEQRKAGQYYRYRKNVDLFHGPSPKFLSGHPTRWWSS